MTTHNDNPGFLDDNGKISSFASNSVEQSTKERDSHVVELNEIQKAKEANVEYDPFAFRNVEHPTTNTETLLHLLKGSMGTGILSMPLAFYHSGYLIGMIGTIAIGAICTYCVHLLIQAAYELSRRRRVPSLTYTATAEAALLEGPPIFQKFAPYSIHAVNGFMLIYQLGICCVYTVFIADNIKDVADQYFGEIDLKLWMLFCLLPLIFINYIKNLKFLAPFSTIANAVTIGCFGIILYYLVKADITFEDKNPVGELTNFPLFVGTVLFALEAIGVILPLENEMKTPKSFGGVCGILNIAMATIIFLYMGMGLLGYLAFGSHVEETITLNLHKTDILAQVAKIMLALAIYITHPLQMYVAIDLVWDQYLGTALEKSRYKNIWDYAIRTVFVLITFLLAVAIPRLDLFISLIGGFCLSVLGLAFPAIIEMSTFWYTFDGSYGMLMIIKDVALILFGMVGLVIGTTTSVNNIVASFQ